MPALSGYSNLTCAIIPGILQENWLQSARTERRQGVNADKVGTSPRREVLWGAGQKSLINLIRIVKRCAFSSTYR